MRVLMVEDGRRSGGVLAGVLRARGVSVDRADSLADAQERICTVPWRMVLLDSRLPDGDGLALIPRIRACPLETTVVVTTDRHQVGECVRGLDAGADDCVDRRCELEELLARLRAVERRRVPDASTLVRKGSLEIDLAVAAVRRDGRAIDLTAKEWTVLRALVERGHRVSTREHLLQSLYGFDDEVGSNTLEVFVCNLRRKLGTRAIQTLRRTGYRLTGD